jgi:hypothetical protein
MKSPARSPGQPPAKAPEPASPLDRILDGEMAKVKGSVRRAVVDQLQTLAEKHPDKFANGLRRLLASDD